MKSLMQIPLWFLFATCSVMVSTTCVIQAQEPAAASDKPAPVAAYLWVDSVPAGAKVSFRDQPYGTAPLFIDGLDEGEYSIKLTRKGYEQLETTCKVPNDGAKRSLQLKQQVGSCVIESTPTNASVYHGSQLVGRTPFAMAAGEVLPGQHSFRVSKVGYQSVDVPMEITADMPAHAKVALLPELGTLKIKTIPATAEVIIERTNYGSLNRLNGDTRRSKELVLNNLVAGKYRITLHYANQLSEIETVTVEAGKEVTKELFFWYPDTRVTMADGQTAEIMTVEKDAKGNRVVLTKDMKLETLDEAMVTKNAPIPEEDAGAIARKERILRKMRRREKAANPVVSPK